MQIALITITEIRSSCLILKPLELELMHTQLEEFLSFLRSDDSMCAFSNSQEILAIENMLNITVRIFWYGIGGNENRAEWKEVSPDPEMAETAHFPKGWVPDMYLYNSDQTHYDLFVSEDHRLAFLGIVGGKSKTEEVEDTIDETLD